MIQLPLPQLKPQFGSGRLLGLGNRRRALRFIGAVGKPRRRSRPGGRQQEVEQPLLAQFYGVDLSFGQQVSVVLVCILGGIGTAGVPAGSIPVVVMILGMVGIPAEGIGMILGVDRFLDMCRTTLNVTGDLAAAVVISRGEPMEPA